MSQVEINITVVPKGHRTLSQPDSELKSEAIYKKIGP
jgi:hypothetical protein